MDILKRPQKGTTKVKFVFNPPDQPVKYENMYNEPSMTYLDLSYVSLFQTSTHTHQNIAASSHDKTETYDSYHQQKLTDTYCN